ncbi:UDP-glucose 4-epimerase GalE [Paludibacterium yongneupense]|uniref:UDP-glucose 4-epimerase GalE n=1 Tax=Paludibacterium yongneupense TaxID=400061 RepID=UPI000410EBA2|nr:UDP-glucose 4-epimerase GalE [Paludibacterium yongneupense]
MATILVTGAAGYIGTHTCIELFAAGHQVVALDNFSNSKPEAMRRVARIAGREPLFHRGDIRDRVALDTLFATHAIDAVIHFAGLKSVGESLSEPLRYYDNNISGSLTLLECMGRAGVRRLVFSSSANVYGDPHTVPVTESFPLGPTNPYGRSKYMMELMLRDLAAAEPAWRIGLLRYFNPVGAHESGLIGEDPHGTPNNLLPYISKVAIGKLEQLNIFGGDYPTADGTGVRDYIHVVDLAAAHVKTLQALEREAGVQTLNVGTGTGYSVLEMVAAFSRISGCAIPFRIVGRRAGDIACSYADPSLAHAVLGWRAQHDLDAMCRDSWRWQQGNPDGYPDD